jgi:archaemetzincin
MKHSFICGVLVLLLASCQKAPTLSLRHQNKGKVVAIQPFGQFDDEQLKRLSLDISYFFRVLVIHLKPIDTPQSVEVNEKGELSADALLAFLDKHKADSVAILIGITPSDIFINADYGSEQRNNHTATQGQNRILGSSYENGNVCIVSANRVAVGGNVFFNDRLYKVIVHEMGHNLGLPHCSNNRCIMSEKNGDISKLDESWDYCKECRGKLN